MAADPTICPNCQIPTSRDVSDGGRTSRCLRCWLEWSVWSPPEAPDLSTQLESLFHTVWTAEEGWRFNDRLDMALKVRRG